MSSDTAQNGHDARDAGAADAPAVPQETAEEAPDPGTAEPAGAPVDAAGVTLPAREREMLAFERQWWRYAGAKEEAIRERFGMSATRYYQVLNALVDRPEALAVDPLLVRRLRRMRAARQRQRPGRVLGSDPPRD
jgi:uncharacterized protein DUF3263